MGAHPTPHPTPEALEAFGLGLLDETQAEVIARHLEDCSECRQRVAEAAPDTFLDRLREAQAKPEPPASGEAEPTLNPLTTGDSPMVPDDTQTAVGDGPYGVGLQPGTRIGYFGDYELQRVLGEGGMGIVYKARQLSLNRAVALKMIRAARFPSADEVRRFHNEAEAVARLDHPNIVPIFEVGRYDDQHYFGMKLIRGESLDKRLKDYVADPRRAARLVAVTADAIHHAHQRGILHRDLKPANILIDSDGGPHVTDFGLAKRVEVDSELTRSGAIMGTPAYMAPEQASGKRGVMTTSTDVYGLGAILYALLTGRAPFGGATVLDTLEQVRERAPEPPRKLNTQVPRDLEVVCLKCLEKDPRRRYASADALAEDLNRWLAGEPIAARHVGSVARVWMWCRRRPVIAGLTTSLLLAVLAGLTGTSLALRAALRAQFKEREQTRLAEQRLYDVRMNLAQRFWEGSNGQLLQQALVEQLPSNQGGIDRRGFEWYYWQRRISSGHLILREHQGSVTSVAFSPDGRRLASAGQDRTVRMWDAATGEEIRELRGHTDAITSVAFSPDGKHLAAASADRTVKYWNAGIGQQENLTLEGHTGIVSSVAFSPDGRRIASASWDRTLKLWDAETGQETLTLKGHTNSVQGVAFSPDGKHLASASTDGTVRVWDAATGREIHALGGPIGHFTSVEYSPDGERLASGGHDGEVKVWHAETGRELLTLRDAALSMVTSVAFSPDGDRLASAGARPMSARYTELNIYKSK